MMVHLLARGHFQKHHAASVCVAGRQQAEASFTVAFHKERLSGLTAAQPTLEASGTTWEQVPRMTMTRGKL